MSRASVSPVDRQTAPRPGPIRPFHFPPVEQGVVPSGLGLLVSPSRGLPVVTVSLLVPAGGAAEPNSAGGLATLVSGLLESGTKRRNAAEIADTLESMGVSLRIRPQWDWVQLGITGLRTHVRNSMDLLAELVRDPVFPEGEVERLRAERLAEIAQARSDPGSLADERVLAAIHSPDSPYHRPLGGVPETVSGIDRAQVAAFHETGYRPAGTTLIATGDVEPGGLSTMAEEVFSGWQGKTSVAPDVHVQPAGASAPVIVDVPGAAQAEIRVGHVGVSRLTPDYFALQVMNAILGGTFSSRLNLNLRERHGFTYGVSSTWSMRRNAGPFVISTAVQTERTGAAVAEIFHEVRAMCERPPGPAELDSARSYLAGVFPLTLQTTDGLAARLAAIAGYELPADYYDSYRERIMAVTADDVLRVARTYLHPDRMVTVVVGDAAAIRSQLADGAVESRGDR